MPKTHTTPPSGAPCACRPSYAKVYVLGMLAMLVGVGAVSWVATRRAMNFCPTEVAASAGAASVEELADGVTAPPFLLVELFTSQGCSSCPAADRLLADIANDAARDPSLPVHVVSWHVDYWNELGWVDPYSSSAATERQRWYTRLPGGPGLYTPQMVVDGTTAFVGSNDREARRAIMPQNARRPRAVALDLRRATRPGCSPLGISYEARGPMNNVRLLFVLTRDRVETDVAAGENAGRRLGHVAVAREATIIPVEASDRVDGKVCFETSLKDLGDGSGHQVLAWVQDEKTGRILGGAALRLDAPAFDEAPASGEAANAGAAAAGPTRRDEPAGRDRLPGTTATVSLSGT